MPSPIDIVERSAGDVTILELKGRLVDDPDQVFQETMNRLVRQGRRMVVLNFDLIDYVDSAGLGLLGEPLHPFDEARRPAQTLQPPSSELSRARHHQASDRVGGVLRRRTTRYRVSRTTDSLLFVRQEALLAQRLDQQSSSHHAGNSNQNVLPACTPGSTPIVPPCASMASLQNGRPNPTEW